MMDVSVAEALGPGLSARSRAVALRIALLALGLASAASASLGRRGEAPHCPSWIDQEFCQSQENRSVLAIQQQTVRPLLCAE